MYLAQNKCSTKLVLVLSQTQQIEGRAIPFPPNTLICSLHKPFWVNNTDNHLLCSGWKKRDHSLLFSPSTMSPNPSGVSISFTSEIYTKPHHFSPHHLLNCSSSHQHLLCLQFSSITHNTVSYGVTLLQCQCKYIFPLFKILQWIFTARRIKSNLAKCSASKPWLGTSIFPRRPQLFHCQQNHLDLFFCHSNRPKDFPCQSLWMWN